MSAIALLAGLCASAGLAICASAGLAISASASTSHRPLRALAAADGRYVGTAIDARLLPGSTRAEPVYSATEAAQFSAVTPENEMKWASVEPAAGQFNWGPADQIVAFAGAHNERVRAHNLVWNRQLPAWLTRGNVTSAQLREILRQHIFTEAGHFKGKVYAWDVVNEPFNGDGTPLQDIWYKAFNGVGYIAAALRWAHQADPHARLYINDYNVEGRNAKSDALYAMVKTFKEQGVPISGVGLESHFSLNELPTDILANMQRFTALHVNVAVTELDVRIHLTAGAATPADLASQAANYATVVNDCLAVRGCVGVTVWGFTDRHSWIPGFLTGQGAGTLYDRRYNPKPAYFAVQAALAAHR
jgi:endo-1,4-beta-xylanase